MKNSKEERKLTPQRHVASQRDGKSHSPDAGKGKSSTYAGRGKSKGKGKGKPKGGNRYGVKALEADFEPESEEPLSEESHSGRSGDEPPDMA